MKIIVLMMLLGAVVGFLLPGVSRSMEERRWYQLDTPPEPAIEILGHTGEYQVATIFFRTEGGVYACVGGQGCTKITKMPDPSKLCKPIGSSVLPAPGEVANSLKVNCWGGEYTLGRDIVLLKDGRVFESSQMVEEWGDVLENLLASCIGGVVGLIVGIIIVIAMSKRRSPAGNGGQ